MGKLEEWYDRQPMDIIFLIAVSPLILMGVVLTAIGFVFG